MICKKCGQEIKEGNNFCTNCGKPVDNSILKPKEIDEKMEIKSDDIIKSNLKIIIPIIVIIIVSIIVCVILKIGNNKNVESNGNNEIGMEEKSTTNIIETGAEYRCTTTGMVGFIKFNTDKDFIMQTGAENSELFTKTGVYAEKENQIELTVNYNDELNNTTEEKKDIPYNEIIKILDNGDLEYVNEYNVTLTFSKNENNTNAETISENLLDEIYAKYPELKDKEGIICTDGMDYWLLDKNGNKVYFYDLESFEQAKEQCNLNLKLDNKKIAKIPNGFYAVEGTQFESGFVISDVKGDDLYNTKDGNQFVWIPVDGILGEDGKTIQNAVDGEIILGRYIFDKEGNIDTKLTPNTLGGEINSNSGLNSFTETSMGNGNAVAKDIEGFIQSVRENGGYYIARFEASKGKNGKVESKYNKNVWNNISQSSAAMACQNLYTGVNSDLVNSYAWDTAILFIQKYGKSNYSRQTTLNHDSISNTGLTNDMQLNICDMASNCWEWTTESSRDVSKPCVGRGGGYNYSYGTTSDRVYLGTTDYYSYSSFRPILYL